jgi:3D (Asp-Asp-Asp) domain-containing protein
MKPAKEGVIAVNPEVIPYGSELMIISGKIVIRGKAQDTGGAMKQNPNQVDILMEDIKEAKSWGRRDVHIIWW